MSRKAQFILAGLILAIPAGHMAWQVPSGQLDINLGHLLLLAGGGTLLGAAWRRTDK